MYSIKEKILLNLQISSIIDNSKFDNLLSAGKFLTVIDCFIRDVFHEDLSFVNNFCSEVDVILCLQSSLEKFLLDINDQSEYNEYDILSVGVACLYYFIQNNMVGPFRSTDDHQIIRNIIKCEESVDREILNNLNEKIINSLNTDDEFISPNTKQPILILLAELIFRSLKKMKSKQWWLMRCLYVRQLLLSDLSPMIHKQLISIIRRFECELQEINDKILTIMFHLEAIQIYLQYCEVSKAQPLLDMVFDNLQLQANLIGALGKRTRFQDHDIAQLTLKIELEDAASSLGNFSDQRILNFPKDHRLEDDIRLPELQLLDRELKKYPSLNGIQQAAILALFVLMKKSKPTDKLQFEELSPYLSYLLSQPKVWCFQIMALFFRSRLEAESSRTIERSITQLQSLITDLELQDSPVQDRIPFVFCSFMVPKWELEMNLAKLLVEVGAIQSALDVYIRLQMWEEIVTCYNYLKLRHKSAEVIRNEMSKQETVQLWYLLGDATDDETCYEKAWQLSQYKSSRAQRHWAFYYFNRKLYEKSIAHFQESLEINSLQISLWFNLGYAALAEEKWDLCANAYRRYCSLEPESFEAWNNLAKAYVKLGQKDRAYKALQEAVKCNYDSWKVWDNLMVVCTDCGNFDEVIKCYHRILDLKKKHVDMEVLRILVKAIENNCVENDVLVVQKRASQLFGRLTSQTMNDAELWELYASLTKTVEANSAEKHEKIVQCLQKAHRIATQEGNWTNTIDKCKNTIRLSLDLAEAQKICCSFITPSQIDQRLKSTKLMLKGIIASVKKVYVDGFDQLNEELVTEIHNLENILLNIENVLSCKNKINL